MSEMAEGNRPVKKEEEEYQEEEEDMEEEEQEDEGQELLKTRISRRRRSRRRSKFCKSWLNKIPLVDSQEIEKLFQLKERPT